jgi:HPt (histidine-containing phosphotransfer) domain-containing protein
MDDDEAEPQVADLDLTTLLEAFGEINEDLRSTLRLFLKTISPQLADVRQKLDNGDIAGASEVAHAAKGVSNTTGALRLGQLCADIDNALRVQDEATARAKLSEVGVIFSAVNAEIQRIINER